MEDESSMKSAIAMVEAWTKANSQPLVALINNAGISFSMPVEFVPLDRMRHLFEVNVFGLVRITQLALPMLRRSHGRVVVVGSVAGVISTPFHGIYAASKFALEALVDAMRLELSPYGVAVVMVEPGYVQTAIGEKGLSHDQPFRHATKEQKSIYPHFFNSQEHMRREHFFNVPLPNVTTTPAIVDSIVSATPRARYVVAGVGVMPASIAVRIFSFVPTPFRDYLVETLR